MKIKIGDMFNLGIKNSGLYSDILYKYQDSDEEKVAIYSSQENILGFLPPSVLKENSIYSTKKAIVMYRQGKAGTLFTPFHDKWACSENAIPIFLKKEYYDKIDLEDFILKVQDLVYERTTSKADNGNASWDMIKGIEIDYKYNEELKKQRKDLKEKYILFKKLKLLLDKQINKVVSEKINSSKVSNSFFVYVGTPYNEEHYYYHEGKIPLVSSQTTNNGIVAYVDDTRKIFDFKGCLTWCIDGKAGTLFYRDYKFDSTHHSGVLVPKKEKEINLKWFLYTQQKYFFENASVKAGNGKLSREAVENFKIEFPDYSLQELIVEEYEKLIILKTFLENAEEVFENKIKKRVNS